MQLEENEVTVRASMPDLLTVLKIRLPSWLKCYVRPTKTYLKALKALKPRVKVFAMK